MGLTPHADSMSQSLCHDQQSMMPCNAHATHSYLNLSLEESPRISTRPQTKTPTSHISATSCTASSPLSHRGCMKRRNSRCVMLSTIKAITYTTSDRVRVGREHLSGVTLCMVTTIHHTKSNTGKAVSSEYTRLGTNSSNCLYIGPTVVSKLKSKSCNYAFSWNYIKSYMACA